MSKKNLQALQAAKTTQAESVSKEAVVETKEKKREPKEKVVKIMYPGLKMNAEGNATVKLEEWPKDFDPKIHARLKRNNFTTEIPFLEKRAERLEHKAHQIRLEIDAIRAGGGKPDGGKKMKQMLKIADRFSSLMGELAGELSPEQMEEFKKMFAAAGATSTDTK